MNPTLVWIVVLAGAIAAGALVYFGLARSRKSEPPLPKEWSLTPRPVFSPQERRLHRQLREALPQQVILAKLPLVRFCHPTDATQVRFWFDLLGAIHVSFAVCNASGRVIAAIDLDDGHNPARRSMQIKQAVLAACHVRYVRYPADQTPSVPELQLLVPPMAATGVPAGASTAVVNAGAKPVTAHALAARQAARTSAHWRDSAGFQKDSAFGRDSVISGFSHSLPSVLPERGGEVIDAPPTRH